MAQKTPFSANIAVSAAASTSAAALFAFCSARRLELVCRSRHFAFRRTFVTASNSASADVDVHSPHARRRESADDRSSLAVRRIAGAKGRGLFALRSFAAGDVVLAQRPLCAVVKPHAFGGARTTPLMHAHAPLTDQTTRPSHVEPSRSPPLESSTSVTHCAHCMGAFASAPATASSSTSNRGASAGIDRSSGAAIFAAAACVTCARTDVFCSASCAHAHHRKYRGLLCECRLATGTSTTISQTSSVAATSVASVPAEIASGTDSSNKYPTMAARLMLEAFFAANSPSQSHPPRSTQNSDSLNSWSRPMTDGQDLRQPPVAWQCIPPSPDGPYSF
jgi:hypothetical protein